MNNLDLQNSIIRSVPRLALGMLHKLSIHAAKGPWDKKSIHEHMAKLDEEVAELKEALARGATFPAILDECADIANMALIISDWAARMDAEPFRASDQQCPHRKITKSASGNVERRCSLPRGHALSCSYPEFA